MAFNFMRARSIECRRGGRDRRVTEEQEPADETYDNEEQKPRQSASTKQARHRRRRGEGAEM